MTKEHTQTLRGIGRHAYRIGCTVGQAVSRAAEALDRKDLTVDERDYVLSGWRDERSEAVRS